MPRTFRVRFRNHFKVDIRFKDTVKFENELNDRGLDFYVDYQSESPSGALIEYYILQKDKTVVSEFLQENEIAVNADAVQFTSLNLQPNFMSLYLKLVGAFIVLMALLQVIDTVVNP